MPRKLEAGGTYRYVLKSDRESGNPPAFMLRILSARDDDRLRSLIDEYRTTADQKRKLELLIASIGIVLAGWNGAMSEPFSVDAAMDILTKRECMELISDATLEAALTPEERKKLESPILSETESFAPDADESAKTG